jgi:nucleotide-binding universal stress UspA family protein
MRLPLVVGVDGSESSLQAVDWAADEAARSGLPLRLVHASQWESYESASFGYDFAGATRMSVEERTVTAAAERAGARRPGLKVSTLVLPEDAEGALLHEAHEATAVITGSRGLGPFTELLLGSVSLAVAARAVCPPARQWNTTPHEALREGSVPPGWTSCAPPRRGHPLPGRSA